MHTQRATEEAAQLVAGFASLAGEAEAAFDAETASATLTAATTALATCSDDSTADAERLTAPIVTALATCEQVAADRAERLRAEAIRYTAEIDADRNAVNGRKDTHQKAIKDAKAASARHTRAVTRTTADIRALPSRIRTLLPDDAIDVSADATAASAAAARAGGQLRATDVIAGAMAAHRAVPRQVDRDLAQGEQGSGVRSGSGGGLSKFGLLPHPRSGKISL
jgi:exonuclease SbcC